MIDLLFNVQRPLLLFYVSAEATFAACGTFASQLCEEKEAFEHTVSLLHTVTKIQFNFQIQNIC